MGSTESVNPMLVLGDYLDDFALYEHYGTSSRCEYNAIHDSYHHSYYCSYKSGLTLKLKH